MTLWCPLGARRKHMTNKDPCITPRTFQGAENNVVLRERARAQLDAVRNHMRVARVNHAPHAPNLIDPD